MVMDWSWPVIFFELAPQDKASVAARSMPKEKEREAKLFHNALLVELEHWNEWGVARQDTLPGPSRGSQIGLRRHVKLRSRSALPAASCPPLRKGRARVGQPPHPGGLKPGSSFSWLVRHPSAHFACSGQAEN